MRHPPVSAHQAFGYALPGQSGGADRLLPSRNAATGSTPSARLAEAINALTQRSQAGEICAELVWIPAHPRRPRIETARRPWLSRFPIQLTRDMATLSGDMAPRLFDASLNPGKGKTSHPGSSA